MTASGRVRIAAKVGVDLPKHWRMLRIPRGIVRAAALGVWTAANCYSRGEEQDGFCPAEAIETYATEEIITWLVDVGLFTREEKDGIHGFRILRFEDWNETKAEIDRRLRSDRLRKKGSKRPKSVQPDSDRRPDSSLTPSGGIPIGTQSESGKKGPGTLGQEQEQDRRSGSEISGELERVPVANATQDGDGGFAVSAWGDGIRQVTGKPHTRLTGGPLRRLLEAFDAHGPKAGRSDWARAKGEAFARARQGSELSPWKFADWLDSGEPTQTRAPRVQPPPPDGGRVFNIGDGK